MGKVHLYQRVNYSISSQHRKKAQYRNFKSFELLTASMAGYEMQAKFLKRKTKAL